MKVRSISVLLMLVMLLAACGDGASSAGSDTTADAGTTADTTAPEPQYTGELPDLGGYEFTFLNQNDVFWTGTHHTLDYESETGDLYSDAVYQRNREAEEKLNFKIKVEKSDLSTMRADMEKLVASGDDVYDAVYLPLHFGGASSFGSDSVLNLNTVDTLQLDQPWWNKSFIESATMKGDVLYTTIDYVNLMGYCFANVLCFNQDMMNNLGVDVSLYDLVREGTWTMDAMNTYMKMAVNMGSQSDFAPKVAGDAVYGFACQHEEGPLMLTQGSGSYLMVMNEERLPALAEDMTRLSNVCDKLTSMLSEPGSCVMTNVPGSEQGQGIDYFLNGRSLFYHSTLGAADSQRFREMANEFGILPAPKYDETQDRYYTNLSQYTFALNIPKSAKDPARTGTVIDYLAFLSYNDVMPVLQQSLCYKGMRNDDSIEMMNLILETEIVDLTVATGIGNDTINGICGSIVKGNLKFASTIASKEKMINSKIDKLFGE
ncbi:MAG: hypothetical protein E7632_13745 [Ruminococcaceae bacterium]|nr:hypothetical protein [Oscillospiraceae bacterium]